MSFEPDVTSPRRVTRAGEYDLIRKMGSGGFGVVFEARHRQTGLQYAIKRIELSVEDAERFRNEALYPARIASQSLHVLGVHSFFHDPDADVFYLVTELIPQGDLRAFLDTQPRPLPLVLALQLGMGIAKGLAAIHAQGIVHRDLKPANVLMDRKDGQWVPKIADFGLARSTRSVSLGEFASSGYAAPEQLDLMSEKPAGPEADLFSFGMVFYELLTGNSASGAKDLREYGRWIAARRLPVPPRQIRSDLGQWPSVETLLASVLVFDPAQRTMTALSCVQTLQRVLQKLEQLEPQTQPQPAMRGPLPPVPPPMMPFVSPVPPEPPPISGPVSGAASGPISGPTPGHVSGPVQVHGRTSGERRDTAPTRPSRAPLIVALLGGAAVLFLIVAAGGWWGWATFRVSDVARRGHAAYAERRWADAFPLLREAAEGGNPSAQGRVGLLYLNGAGVQQSDTEAKKWFDRAIENSDPTGHSGLGWMTLFGRGVSKNEREGVRLLRIGADANDSTGVTWLGRAYELGLAVPKSDVEALKYYRRGAEAGHQFARESLARFYDEGRGGLAKSQSEAITWWERAAQDGSSEAQCALGYVYRARHLEARGRATAPVPATWSETEPVATESVRWYRQAADAGHTCGQSGLGYAYWFGYGVPASYDESIRWYELAAAQKDENAISNLAKVRAGFELPPLFIGPWRQVIAAERRQEVEALKGEGLLAKVDTTDPRRMRRIELDFYDGASLFELEVGRGDGTVGVLTYIRHGGRMIRIDGKATQIHELSASAPIRIDTTPRAMSFLRFFMGAIQGDHGTFRVIDSASDVAWLPTAPQYQKNTTGAQIAPANLTPSSAGGWSAIASLQYGDAVFRATLWLKPNGMVEMLKDDPLGADLAVAQERFDDKGLRIRAASKAR
jgi:TPR repeat protein/serine/threonine protein kinase